MTSNDVLHLQSTLGNRAVGRMLAQGRPPQPVRQTAGRGVVQRLKKGDFKELALLGLDVGTWIEFAEAVKKMSRHALVMAYASLESKKGDDLDITRAKLLIDKQKHRLTPPSSRSRIPDYYFGNESGSKAAKGTVVEEERKRQIVVGDGIAETTIIRTASDLLIWLVSHPTGSAKAPRAFAETDILIAVLDELWKKNRVIDPPEVWDALREVVNKRNEDESEDENELDDEEHAGVNWEEGEWEEVMEHHVPVKEPARYRRKVPPKEYRAAIEALSSQLSGHRLVGLHATRIESVGTLVREGVSRDRFNTGHGVGKGNGFYIIPTTGKVNKRVSEAASSWGRHFVAVYLPGDCEAVRAGEGETVQTLEAQNKGRRRYYEFGEAEAVIPPSLSGEVVLVSDPADISMADPAYEAEVDRREPFEFVKFLPRG